MPAALVQNRTIRRTEAPARITGIVLGSSLLVRSVLAAGILVTAARASALPTQIVYDATIFDGQDLSDASDVGVLLFELDADTGRSCRYYMEWMNPNDTPLSVDCFVEEAKTHGGASCFANASNPVDTIITNDPRLPCSGWDTNGQAAPVFLYLLGESSETPYLNGIVQFSPAGPWLYGFGAAPYP